MFLQSTIQYYNGYIEKNNSNTIFLKNSMKQQYPGNIVTNKVIFIYDNCIFKSGDSIVVLLCAMFLDDVGVHGPLQFSALCSS